MKEHSLNIHLFQDYCYDLKCPFITYRAQSTLDVRGLKTFPILCSQTTDNDLRMEIDQEQN